MSQNVKKGWDLGKPETSPNIGVQREPRANLADWSRRQRGRSQRRGVCTLPAISGAEWEETGVSKTPEGLG